MKEKNILFFTTRLCVGILGIFMLTSVLTYVVQKVLCEDMHMDNSFVRFVIGDDKVEEIMTNLSQPYEVYVDWATMYPFSEETDIETIQPAELQQSIQQEKTVSDKIASVYTTVWNYLKTGVDQYTGNLHMFFSDMVSAGEAYNKIVSWDYLATQSGELRTFTMKDGTLGYLTDELSDETIETIVASVADFAAYLEETEIPFLYVNPGTKICEEEYEVPAYLSDYIVQNQNKFLEGLEEKAIDYIDLREALHAEGKNHKKSFYVTDPHWRFETALWATGKIAAYANENYGFEFDLDSFAEENYTITEYKNAFMGTQGLALHLAENRKEDFKTIYPVEDGLYNIKIFSRELDMTGSFKDVFVMQERAEVASRMYDSWRVRNDALVEIDNLQAEHNQDKKILLLYDSFSWPLMAYMATDIAEIDAIHTPEFTGSIRTYLEQTQPDLVIMLVTPKNITEIDWNTHTSIFDLR